MVNARGFVTAALSVMALAATPARSQNPFRDAPPEVENELKVRVEEFYNYFREGRFRQAEQLVAEESRDQFYGAKKARIFGYEIRDLKFSEDLSEAKVLVTCLTLVPGLGSKPLSMPLPSTWKLADGKWYLFFQTRGDTENFQSPAGQMRFDRNAPAPGNLATVQPVTLESLEKMYTASPDRLEFSSRVTEPVTKTIEVRNRSRGKLTLETDSKGMPGITIDLGAEEFGPGESLTISVTYVPHELLGPGEYSLHFVVQPILQSFKVDLVID